MYYCNYIDIISKVSFSRDASPLTARKPMTSVRLIRNVSESHFKRMSKLIVPQFKTRSVAATPSVAGDSSPRQKNANRILNSNNNASYDIRKLNHMMNESQQIEEFSQIDQLSAFNGAPNFFECLYQSDGQNGVIVASPKQRKEILKVFNQFYGVQGIYGADHDNYVSLFNSQMAAVAARKRVLAHSKTPRDEQEIKRLNEEVRKRSLSNERQQQPKKQLFDVMDQNRLLELIKREIMQKNDAKLYSSYMKHVKQKSPQKINEKGVFERLRTKELSKPKIDIKRIVSAYKRKPEEVRLSGSNEPLQNVKTSKKNRVITQEYLEELRENMENERAENARKNKMRKNEDDEVYDSQSEEEERFYWREMLAYYQQLMRERKKPEERIRQKLDEIKDTVLFNRF